VVVVLLVGNAERAEGPWRVSYTRFAELRDLAGGRLRRADASFGANPAAPVSPERVTVLADSVVALVAAGRTSGGAPTLFDDAVDRMDGSPERALRLADASTGLRWTRALNRWGVPHDVVAFPYRNGTMRLEISRESHLPTAVEIARPYPHDFRRGLVDATLRTDYVDWNPDSTGIWWPRQHKVAFNGEPLRDVTMARVLFSPAEAPADSFVVPDSARLQYAANVRTSPAAFRFGMRGPAEEPWPGIVRAKDFWTMTMVKQDDGVVLFEAHLSGAYLREVIDTARARFGLPVKAIVMTSDPWAHLGGVREAVALGIPIYVNARSLPFLQAHVRAPRTQDPDALAKAPRAPKFVPISAKTTLGRGANRLELYPVGGAYAERMVMAYFPEKKLLYGADLVFANRGGAPGYVRAPAIDLRNAVAREGLAVDTLFCVQQSAPIAWTTFVPGGA
jgi:hypothetical protein